MQFNKNDLHSLLKLKLQNSFSVIIAFSGWLDANQVATYSAQIYDKQF